MATYRGLLLRLRYSQPASHPFFLPVSICMPISSQLHLDRMLLPEWTNLWLPEKRLYCGRLSLPRSDPASNADRKFPVSFRG